MAEAITHGVISVALIAAAVIVTVTGHDAQIVWGIAGGYLGGSGVAVGAKAVLHG